MHFFYVRLRTCAQYVSMNEFMCCEHSKKRSTGNQPLGTFTFPYFNCRSPSPPEFERFVLGKEMQP